MPWRMAAGRIASSRATSKLPAGRLHRHGESHLGIPQSWESKSATGVEQIWYFARHDFASICPCVLPTPPSLRPLAALRRPRLLIIGCGDVGQRVARALRNRWRITALTSSAERVPALRALGLRPLRGDLDQPATLRRLAAPGAVRAALGAAAGSGRRRPAHPRAAAELVAQPGAAAAGLPPAPAASMAMRGGAPALTETPPPWRPPPPAPAAGSRPKARSATWGPPGRAQRPACWRIPGIYARRPPRRPPARAPAARHAGAGARR